MAKDVPKLFVPRRRRWPWILLLLLFAAAVGNHYFQWRPWPWTPKPPPQTKLRSQVVAPEKIIDFTKIKEQSDQSLKRMIDERKDDYGLRSSVDMVVEAQESIRVGRETVSIAEILDEIIKSPDKLPVLEPPVHRELKETDISEKSPPLPKHSPSSTPEPTDRGKPKEFYGIYVVRAGDNLWDIHFAFLREYLRHKDIDVSPNADEGVGGRSTGVSRILKYAEKMVHIFNMKTRELDTNLDTLEPESKVVIFNLTNLERILGRITPENLDRIRFDGKELYLPESQPAGGQSSG